MAVSVPNLTIGTPVSSSFTTNQSDVYYELDATAGSSIVLALSGGAAAATNGIYVSFNSLPTTYEADDQSPLTGPNPTLAVTAAVSGTYYILVHNQSGSPGAFNLSASLSGLMLLSSAPVTVGNAGQATLSIKGLDLEPGTVFTLTGTSSPITGTTSPLSSATLAYVTFDLSGVAPGTYGLNAENPDGSTAALGGAVVVTAGGGPDVVATLIGDGFVRSDRTAVMYLQYANFGDDDAGAPLITLSSTAGVTIGLDTNGTPTDAVLQLLGINQNGPAGILPPGASFQIPIDVNADISGTFMIGVDAASTTDTQALAWTAIEPEISADVTAASNWPAVYAQLQQMTGTTWGQYISMIDHDATLLPASVGDPSDPTDVLQLAVNQAVAAVSTSISGVALGTAPGVVLAGNTMTATNSTTGDVFTTNILADGSFVFPTVTAGSYTFSVTDDLIDGSPAPVAVSAGQAVTGVTVTLDPEVTLSGQVTAGGIPVAGAYVSVWTATAMVADVQTDANGNYVATFVPGTYTLEVDAQGLARSYSDVALAAGPQALNIALAPESAVSGDVSLSDGQTTTSIEVVAILQGSEPNPYFGVTLTSGDFLLGSLPPGVYEFSISASGYNPTTISDVPIGQGQTVNLGAIELTPVDPVASEVMAAQRNFAEFVVSRFFVADGAISGATGLQQIFQEYFAGPAVAKPFQVLGLIPLQDYIYDNSTALNPTVSLTDDVDINGFKNNPTTMSALQETLKQIINSGLQNVPMVQAWLAPFEANGTIPAPLTLSVAQTMQYLNLGGWQYVNIPGSAAANAWNYGNFSTIPGLIAGGVSPGDDRIVTGTLVLSVGCDGKVTVTPNFQVQVDDNFVLGSSGNFWYAQVAGRALIDLENWDMAARVPFTVQFPGPSIDPGRFSVHPPGSNPCMSGDCAPAQTMACDDFTAIKPVDPNALLGPVGFGTLGFVQPGGTWLYTVDFENDGTAAAQNVTVTEQLDSSLDWSTFQLGSFGFGTVNVSVPAGLTEYQTTVSYENTDGSLLNVQVDLDFNVQTGLLTVTFTSLDPTTGEAPTGVFDGFLPPDNSSGIGEGYVTYIVQPKSALTTGTTINQQASVVFDTNAALATNTVVNTIDASPPSSSVAALPATTTNTSLTISWSGDDGAGPGIADYNVYVSDDGGAFTLWQSDTTATSAIFTGQVGHTYAFYSVATDNLALVQPTPTVAQAIIEFVSPLSLSSISAVAPSRRHTSVSSIDVTFSEPVNLSTFTDAALMLSDNGGPNLITSAVTIALVSGSTYQISGLAALTAANGNDTLTVNSADIQDQNGASGTNSLSTSWLMDTTPPTSTVSALPARETNLAFPVSVTGRDGGDPASGMASYAIYVAINGGAWSLWTTVPASSPTATYSGQSNTTYLFYSIATDNAGNVESKKPAIEASTYVPNLTAPITSVDGTKGTNPTTVNTATGTMTLSITGSDPGGGVVAEFEVFVSVDSGPYTMVNGAAIPAGPPSSQGMSSATIPYQGLTDGSKHTYSFYSIGIDSAGNVQSAPTTPNLSLTETFAPPSALQVTNLIVENGAVERSYIRYLDIAFNESNSQSGGELTQIADSIGTSSPEIVIYKYDLNGDASSKTAVSLAGVTVSVIDHAIELDFGAGGIGGNPQTTIADGYYEVDIKLPNGQTAVHHFYRLLGDVDGDGTVDQTDLNEIAADVAVSSPSGMTPLNAAVTGDVTVSALDLLVATRSKGRKLGSGLSIG